MCGRVQSYKLSGNKKMHSALFGQAALLFYFIFLSKMLITLLFTQIMSHKNVAQFVV